MNKVTESVLAYFEKEYGGKPLLKRAKRIAVEKGLIFNSSMVNSDNQYLWKTSGWLEKEKLNVLSLNLKTTKNNNPKLLFIIYIYTDIKKKKGV